MFDQPRIRRISTAAVALSLIAGAFGSTPAAASPAAPATQQRVIEAMTLRCAPRDGDVAAIGCRWSVPDGAAGVRLIRIALGSGMGRVAIHRADDPTENSFIDAPVRRGVRYLYAVRAVDADGRLVGAGRPVVTGVPALDEPPTVEVLRLRCAATGASTVRCGWSGPDEPARLLTLWRSVDGGARERVASFQPPFATSYGDRVPPSSSRAVYAVIATDGAGDIVARSRPDGVVFPDTGPPVIGVDPVESRPVETRPAETRPAETRPAETAARQRRGRRRRGRRRRSPSRPALCRPARSRRGRPRRDRSRRGRSRRDPSRRDPSRRGLPTSGPIRCRRGMENGRTDTCGGGAGGQGVMTTGTTTSWSPPPVPAITMRSLSCSDDTDPMS